MKHIKLLVLCSIPVLLAGCEAEKLTDEQILSSRETNVLEVSYAMNGETVNGLSFSHNPYRYSLDVSINDDNLRWTLESDREWCKVASDINTGPGTVLLDIAANEDFEDRDAATLTFVAGEYRGYKLKVQQSASDFIVSQPFTLASPAESSFVCKVTTLAGTQWSFSTENWLSVKRDDAVKNGEMETTTLTLSIGRNDGASRFGQISLSAGNNTEAISVFQFGNEYEYDSQGRLVLPGAESRIDITVPDYIVAEMTLPAFASYTVTDQEGPLSIVSVTVAENLSDCAETREVQASMSLANGSASVVALPAMVQGFLPAHGLVTAKGLQAFAEAVAAGQPTSDWEENGVVTMVQDIDMDGVSGWKGIGSEAKPFTGKFDGGGHAILNLKKTSSGIFATCKGATISNLTLGKGCSLYYNNEDYNKGAWLGGIANKAEATNFSRCSVTGEVEYAGISADDTDAYVGGIVGECDASSSIRNCKLAGKLSISTGSDPDITVHVGGICGRAEGVVNACEMSGTITLSTGIGSANAGGISGVLLPAASVEGNSFLGVMNINGNIKKLACGGLYGSIPSGSRSFDNASDKSVSLGEINIDSWAADASTRIFAGGFAGYAGAGTSLSFKDYEVQTRFHVDRSATRQTDFLCIGGILGGCDPEQACASMDFSGITNLGSVSFLFSATLRSYLRRCLVGGIAGFVNGPASFVACINKGALGEPDSAGNFRPGATSNDCTQVIGGIAGVAMGGNCKIEKCDNFGAITNYMYCNRLPGVVWGGWYISICSGGILGAFDYKPESDGGTLTVSSCTSNAEVASFRGYAGGIVGFARNASISSCTSYAPMERTNNNSSHKGGIVAGLCGSSSVSSCTAKSDLYSYAQGGATASPGGILSISLGGKVSVSGCSFFGNIGGAGTPVAGGLVSTADDDTTVSGCRFGGSIQNVAMSENNVSANAVGNGKGSISDITWWSGN